MSNANVSRLGQAENTGDARALFLTRWGGEVFAAFRTKTVAMERHRVRSIDSGKTASFPELGKGGSEYHVPGTEISGSLVAQNERLVTIDDLLIAPRFLAGIDEAMNHWDARSEYTSDAGDAMAQAFDKHVLQMGVLTARATGQAGNPNGTALTDADGNTNGASLAATIFDIAKTFDENDVPEEDRFFFCKPAQYYLLAQTTDMINKDFGGAGAIAEGTILKIANISIIKTNNLPITNITGDLAKYNGDFSTTIGLGMQRQAVGTVKLIDLAVEMEYDIRRQGHLIVAKMAIGHGILRPQCAIEVKTA